jgi:hypothetical protein
VFTLVFWAQALERALKSTAQALLVVWGSAEVNVLTVNWTTAVGVALTAGLVSLLASVASLPFGPTNSPSLVAPPLTGAHEK